jgi:hypothetical protein
MSMPTLESLVPAFAGEVKAALARKHPELAAAIPGMRIRDCTHDADAGAGYIYLDTPPYSVPAVHNEGAHVALTIPFGEPHWFNVDVDHEGNALGIELLGRNDVVSLLKGAGAL